MQQQALQARLPDLSTPYVPGAGVFPGHGPPCRDPLSLRLYRACPATATGPPPVASERRVAHQSRKQRRPHGNPTGPVPEPGVTDRPPGFPGAYSRPDRIVPIRSTSDNRPPIPPGRPGLFSAPPTLSTPDRSPVASCRCWDQTPPGAAGRCRSQPGRLQSSDWFRRWPWPAPPYIDPQARERWPDPAAPISGCRRAVQPTHGLAGCQ